MRRWRGPINQWVVELTLISYDEHNRELIQFLAHLLDPVMESLAQFVMTDPVITNSASYIWVSEANEMAEFNRRLQASDTFAANAFAVNNLTTVSIFTFVTTGPVGHALQPST